MYGMNYGNKKGKGVAGAGGGKGAWGGGGGGGGKGAWGGDPWAESAASWGESAAASWGGGKAKGGAGQSGAWGGNGGGKAAAPAKGGGGGRNPAWFPPKRGEAKPRGYQDFTPAGEGNLYEAVQEAVAAMGHLETEWTPEKLEKKLREYFNKASKSMTFEGALPELIDQYCNNAMSSIYSGLGDREWLYSGQVDFLLIVDAGIKDAFPRFLLRSVAQADFEQLVLASYERAFDEQRFEPILSEKLPEVISGPKIKKKVWNAVDQGRKEACAAGHDEVQEFTRVWIDCSVKSLSDATGGGPEHTCPAGQMAQLFTILLEAGALPTALMANAEAPLEIVEEAVAEAYSQHTTGVWQPQAGEAGGAVSNPAKKLKSGVATWGAPNYGGKGAALLANRAAMKASKAEAEVDVAEG